MEKKMPLQVQRRTLVDGEVKEYVYQRRPALWPKTQREIPPEYYEDYIYTLKLLKITKPENIPRVIQFLAFISRTEDAQPPMPM